MQILFAFCRGGVSKTKSKIRISHVQKQIYLHLAEAEISKTKSKVQKRGQNKTTGFVFFGRVSLLFTKVGENIQK